MNWPAGYLKEEQEFVKREQFHWDSDPIEHNQILLLSKRQEFARIQLGKYSDMVVELGNKLVTEGEAYDGIMKMYMELIDAVQEKVAGESRFETAVRLIGEAQKCDGLEINV